MHPESRVETPFMQKEEEGDAHSHPQSFEDLVFLSTYSFGCHCLQPAEPFVSGKLAFQNRICNKRQGHKPANPNSPLKELSATALPLIL